MDATYIELQRPKDPLLERRTYSTYKKMHAIFFIAVIDREGEQQGAMMSSSATAGSHLLILAPSACSVCVFCVCPQASSATSTEETHH